MCGFWEEKNFHPFLGIEFREEEDSLGVDPSVLEVGVVPVKVGDMNRIIIADGEPGVSAHSLRSVTGFRGPNDSVPI
ncbi:hypothetical protein H8D30_07125 [bacterium]|nr:hypothetical protein [bacterium]